MTRTQRQRAARRTPTCTARGALPQRARADRLVRPHVSDLRDVAATFMPERNDLQCVATHTVVNEVVDAPQAEPSDYFRARRFHFASDTRLEDEHFKGAA